MNIPPIIIIIGILLIIGILIGIFLLLRRFLNNMIALGILMLIGGIISAIYGVYLNNDVTAQLESFFSEGKSNPGDMFLYIGIIVAVLGVVFIIIGSVRNSNRRRPQYPPYGMPPQYPVYGVPVQPQAPVQTAFCSGCGTKLDTDAKFCPSCGAQVK